MLVYFSETIIIDSDVKFMFIPIVFISLSEYALRFFRFCIIMLLFEYVTKVKLVVQSEIILILIANVDDIMTIIK